MSYLNSKNGVQDVKKAVISFWFRVPQESMDKALAQGKDGHFEGVIWVVPPLNRVVPLVVMGVPGKQTTYNTDSELVVAYERHEWVWHYPDPDFEATMLSEWMAPWETPDGPWGNELQPGGIPVWHRIWDYHYLGPTSGEWLDFSHAFVNPNPDDNKDAIFTTTPMGAADINPSVIGIDVSGGRPTLYVNLETGTVAKVVGGGSSRTSIVPDVHWSPPTTAGDSHDIWEAVYPIGVQLPLTPEESAMQNGGQGTDFPDTPDPVTASSDPPGGENSTRTDTYEDVTDATMGKNTAAFANNVSTIDVLPDEWHHVLISFEIKPCVTVGQPASRDPIDWNDPQFLKSAPKLWIAMDDKNYDKDDLSYNWSEGMDPNEVLSDGAELIRGNFPPVMAVFNASRYGGGQDDDIVYGPVPSYNADCSKVVCEPIGFPATEEFVDHVVRVELAEFQMFTDVSLDTGQEKNRRAFADYKRDKDGNRIGDKGLQPAKLQKAVDLLGKKPTVLLHGSGNWRSGSNTGTSGKNQDGKKLESGQLDPTGKIVAYKPEPALGE